MINFGLPSINIPPGICWGGVVLAIGVAGLIVFVMKLRATAIVLVADGTPADAAFADWADSRLRERVTKPWLAVLFFAIGLILGGCGIVSISFLVR